MQKTIGKLDKNKAHQQNLFPQKNADSTSNLQTNVKELDTAGTLSN